MKITSEFRTSARLIWLLLSVAVSMSLLFALIATEETGRALAQASVDCSNSIAVPNPDSNHGLVSDCETLLELRDTLAGHASLNWSSDTNMEEWDGIEVSRAAGRVIGLDLMAHFEIEGKGLSGQVPLEFGMLSGLEYLHLGNRLTVCSDDECREVEDHERNRLTGPLPHQLSNLPDLTELDLSGNQLTGEIPFELGNLRYLTHLRLNGNELTGSIPTSLGDLPNLEWLDLSWNQLSGTVPSELGNFQYLTELYLDGNELTGSIPIELGGLPSLLWLSLSGNQLSGEIPVELGNLSGLTDLYLDENELTGSIPAVLDGMPSLERLGLSGNQLSGEIPVELGSLPSLIGLYLDRNELTGSIPVELGDLSNLEDLYLAENQISGCVPSELRDIENNDIEELGLSFCSGEPTPTPEQPADSCVGTVSGNGTITGSWDSDCASEGRSGSYASYYSFALTESADVTITAESNVDTWLFLREGTGRDGAVVDENDDHDSTEFTLASTTDSGISESLNAGTYTIEVTTYTAGEAGEFTLTISGLPAAVEPTPTPEPTPGPSPEPTPTPEPPADSCVSVVSGNGAISGSWHSDCASEGRSGSYASYYTFTLAESADVTFTAESTVDTYLNLREGAGRDGTILHFNDDHDSSEFSLPSSTDSGISESLSVGSYIIEVTTYTTGETGEFTLTIGGLPAAVTPTPEPTPTITITFGDLNWSSVRLQTRIAQYIAEKGYGYSTSVDSGTSGPLFQALREGNIDVLMEVWLPNQQEVWEAALAEGSASSPGRSLGTDWQSAFVIPKYLQEQYPDLDSVEDLKEEQNKSLFATDETDGKARLVSCVIGWECEGVNAKQIEGYGLLDHIHIVNPDSGGALNSDLTEAYENAEAWLGFQWGTNETALLLDLVRLEEPAYSDECWATTMACAHEDSTILIAVKAGLSEPVDDFVDVLTKWDFNVDGVYKLVVRWQADNPDANTEDAAMWWLRGNGDVWSEWVTADASAAIQSALDSGEIPEGWPEAPNITPDPTPTPEPSPTPTPTPEPPADSCVSVVSGNGAISGSWHSDCASEGRSGSYASYYTFTLAESTDVTFTAESSVDTYLFLREGSGRDGTEVASNDDHADESDCTAEFARSTDSCIVETLDAGTYTIEVTTYTAGEIGEFTLTIGGLPAVVLGPSTDRAALVALYNATNGANWTDKANWLSDEPLGEWQGVTTDDDGSVTQIRLGDNNLVGSIPSDLGDLSNLEILALEVNQISGVIPGELGNLSNLTVLDMPGTI